MFLNEDLKEKILELNSSLKIYKKPIFFQDGMIKIEYTHPIVNVLFLNNDKIKYQLNHNNFHKYLIKVPIARNMNGSDLKNMLILIAFKYFQEEKYILQNTKILIPENYNFDR